MAWPLTVISQTVWSSAKSGQIEASEWARLISLCVSLAQRPSALKLSPITEQQNTWSRLQGVSACGCGRLQFWAHTRLALPHSLRLSPPPLGNMRLLFLFLLLRQREGDAHLHWPDKSVMCHPPPSHLHLSLICLPPPLQSSSHTSTRLIRLCRTDIVCPSCASREQVAADVLWLCRNPKLTYYLSYCMQKLR